MYRKILLPIDLTEAEMTDRAISVAQALAKTFDSEMRVVKRAVAPAHLFSRLRA
ncbi:MAG: UspA domain-containing protein [Methylocystaceae bacterium]|nr:MAG: UspA domain-containing [Methylocystaceae bacterium]TXT44403.1 MAG: UspA domain-containing protein [Methylocystaceae bacterium]